MRGDELVRRFAVAMLAPALGEHEFFLRFQHREPLDFRKIAREPHSAEIIGSAAAIRSSFRGTPCGASALPRRAGRRTATYSSAGPWLKEGESERRHSYPADDKFVMSLAAPAVRSLPSQDADKIIKSSGSGLSKARFCPVTGMVEAEDRGMQRLAAEGVERARAVRPDSAARLGLETRSHRPDRRAADGRYGRDGRGSGGCGRFRAGRRRGSRRRSVPSPKFRGAANA